MDVTTIDQDQQKFLERILELVVESDLALSVLPDIDDEVNDQDTVTYETLLEKGYPRPMLFLEALGTYLGIPEENYPCPEVGEKWDTQIHYDRDWMNDILFDYSPKDALSIYIKEARRIHVNT